VQCHGAESEHVVGAVHPQTYGNKTTEVLLRSMKVSSACCCFWGYCFFQKILSLKFSFPPSGVTMSLFNFGFLFFCLIFFFFFSFFLALFL